MSRIRCTPLQKPLCGVYSKLNGSPSCIMSILKVFLKYVNFYCALQQGTVKIKRGMMPFGVIYADDILTFTNVIKKQTNPESKWYKYSNNLYLKMINAMFVRI